MTEISEDYKFQDGDCYVNIFDNPSMINIMCVRALSENSSEFTMIAKCSKFKYNPFILKKRSSAYFSSTNILKALYL